jgi:hypothetical protein
MLEYFQIFTDIFSKRPFGETGPADCWYPFHYASIFSFELEGGPQVRILSQLATRKREAQLFLVNR